MLLEELRRKISPVYEVKGRSALFFQFRWRQMATSVSAHETHQYQFSQAEAAVCTKSLL